MDIKVLELILGFSGLDVIKKTGKHIEKKKKSEIKIEKSAFKSTGSFMSVTTWSINHVMSF